MQRIKREARLPPPAVRATACPPPVSPAWALIAIAIAPPGSLHSLQGTRGQCPREMEEEPDFAALYGEAEAPQAAPVKPDPEANGVAAAPAATEGEGDLFLQLYGSEAPQELKAEPSGDRDCLGRCGNTR